MKLNLTPDQTERVTKCRAALIVQQQKISDLQESLPEIEAKATEAERDAAAVFKAANPREEKSIRAATEAKMRAELWQAEIGKVQKQIEIEEKNLQPLCISAGQLFCEIIDAALVVLEREVTAFYSRHFEFENVVKFRTSETSSIKYLDGQKEFYLSQVIGVRAREDVGPSPEFPDECVRRLGGLLGENDGVQQFLFDGTESFDLAAD